MTEIGISKFIKNFFTKGNERTLKAKRNISVSFVCKGLSILISFLIVPLTLSYVGKVEYGIWMTISAIIQWFIFFDIGLGNGLRTKLAEALAQNDMKLARIYISSVFAVIIGISIALFFGFLIVASFISWNLVLNTYVVSNHELYLIVVMVFFFFCISFVLGLVSSILQAQQHYALNDVLGLIAQLFGLVALYFLVKTTEGSLFYLCLVYGSKTAIVMFVATIILFLGPLKSLRPSMKYLDFKEALPLLNLGIKFFINQILYLIVTQTSVILVVQFFGPQEVTVFNLALRYMSISSMIYLLVLTPFLSAFTEAYTKHDLVWIRNVFSRIRLVWLLASIVTIFMVLGYKIFFEFWVGDTVSIPLTLIVGLAALNISNMWNGTYGLFLNGIGKIQIQLYLLGTQAILFFPLSYLFYRMQLGLVSIILAQTILTVFNIFVVTIQYNKIMNNQAKGLWLK